MDETAAIRNARTMVTSAECKGRQDSYIRAQNDGIVMQRRWIATKDARTRHWHAELDGALAEVDEPFENAIGKIMYPGDPSADGANVYNCRCTIAAKVLGFKKVSGNTSANPLTQSRGSGIIGLQFFAERDIERQESGSLVRAIRKYRRRIEDHEKKISSPEKFIENWEELDPREQQGCIKHWHKEIRNFETSIDNRIEELKRRGEYNDQL